MKTVVLKHENTHGGIFNTMPRSNNNSKLCLFLKNARFLTEKFGIIPLLYGSLGLECLTGENLDADDIDILIPHVFINDKWNDFKASLELQGFTLTDEHEHTFAFDGDAFSYADIEELQTFADIRIEDIATREIEDVRFMLLSLEQYLQVYRQSIKDGYRISVRCKKDNDKILFIEKLLQRH